MRRADRETAIAFGDVLDRDAQAEFGALDLSAALKAQVKTAAAKVATTYAAPSALKSQAKAPVASGKVAVSASVMAPVPPKPLTAVKAPVPPKPTSTAAAKSSVVPAYPNVSNANFLDPGAGPISSPVLAPALTPAQKAANAKAVAANKAAEVKLADQKTAEINRAGLQKRADDAAADAKLRADLYANDPHYKALIDSQKETRTDWAPFVHAAQVLATGAAIITTGGAAAGAVGLTAGGATLATAAAADKVASVIEKGGAIAKQAKGVVSDVKAAAAKGDAIAKTAASAIDAATKARVTDLVPKGVERALTDAGKQAVDAVGKVAGAVSASGTLSVSALGNLLDPGGGAQHVAAVANAMGVAAQKPGNTSSGFAAASVLAKRPVVAVQASVPQALAKAKLAAGFDGAPARPRWLVSAAGKVADVDVTPNAVNGSGWLVWTNGNVVKQ